MGCNCKKDKEELEVTKKKINSSKNPLIIRGLIFLVKIIIFLFSSAIVAIIVLPFSIYMLSKVVFYDGEIDTSGIILSIGEKFKKYKKNREDDDDNYDDDDE